MRCDIIQTFHLTFLLRGSQFLVNWMMPFFSRIRPNSQRIVAIAQPVASCDYQQDIDNKRHQSSMGVIRHHQKSKSRQTIRLIYRQWIRYDVSKNSLLTLLHRIISHGLTHLLLVYYGAHWQAKRNKSNSSPFRRCGQLDTHWSCEGRSAWSFLVDLQRINDNDTPEK